MSEPTKLLTPLAVVPRVTSKAVVIVDREGNWVCQFNRQSMPDLTFKQTVVVANDLVRRVNMHDGFVAVCKLATRQIRALISQLDNGPWADVINELEAALAETAEVTG